MKCVFLTLLFICELALSIGTTDINSLVVSTTESMKDKANRETEDVSNDFTSSVDDVKYVCLIESSG
jgi:hypothetical protein